MGIAGFPDTGELTKLRHGRSRRWPFHSIGGQYFGWQERPEPPSRTGGQSLAFHELYAHAGRATKHVAQFVAASDRHWRSRR
jgi:hypothetical protein